MVLEIFLMVMEKNGGAGEVLMVVVEIEVLMREVVVEMVEGIN